MRMVNHSDNAVKAVLISGPTVILDGAPADILGRVRTGSFLRARRPSPAVPVGAAGVAGA